MICRAVFRSGLIGGIAENRIKAVTIFDDSFSNRLLRACPADSSITQKRITPI